MLLASCESPQKGELIDLVTPDSVGMGMSEGTASFETLGKGYFDSRHPAFQTKSEGEVESESSSVFLTWNLPQFTDHEANEKERKRDRYISAIRSSIVNLEELAAYQMERDVEISTAHSSLVDSFLIDSDRKEQQLDLVSKNLEKVHTALTGLEGLILYNTERLSEVENLIPTVEDLVPEVEEVTLVVNYPLTEVVTPQESEVSLPPEITESSLAANIDLEEPGRPLWLWALVIVGFLANAYVVYRIMTSKPEKPTYIPASEVSGSLAWLRDDLLKDSK